MRPWRNRSDSPLQPPGPSRARFPETVLRRPLIGALVVFVPGALTGLALPISALGPLLFAGAVIIAGVLWWRHPVSIALIWLSVFLLAWAHTALSVRTPSARALGALMERSHEHIQVRGVIVDDPVADPARRGEAVMWRLTLRVDEVNRVGHFRKATGRMDVRWLQPAGAVHPSYGERWMFTGVVQHSEHEHWRWAFRAPYRMRVHDASAQRLSVGHGSPLVRLALAGRHKAAERLGLGLDAYPEEAGILRALLLGYRHDVPREKHRLFALTGTLHIFAISGLHVGIVGALLLVGVRACGVSRTRWVLYVGPLLIVYTVATGMRPSAVRACVMAMTFGSAFLFNRKPDAPSAWALAALLILLAAPAQLTSPGFIFSFVIVAGMIRLYPLLAGPARAGWAPGAYRIDTSGGVAPAWRGGLRWLAGLAAASVAAWVASAPLTAQYFNLFSPVGLVGNLLVIPGAFLVVLTGFLALVFGAVGDVAAEIFNHANRLILTGLIAVVDGLAKAPGGHWHVRSPGAYWIAVWYGAVFGGVVLRSRRWRWAGGAALMLMVAGLWAYHADRATRVTVMNAGDGHAVLVRSGGAYILFDAGPAYRSERLIRSLRSAGVNRLDVLVLSHPSAAHAGGAEAIMRAMPVRALWRTDFVSRSPAYDRAVAYAREQRIPQTRIRAGDRGEWAGGLAWEMVHPSDPFGYRRAADASVVMRVSRGGAAVLLMGGGGAVAERDMLRARHDPAASVLVIGNQGRDGAASTDWLEAVQPEAVVLAVGAYNRGGYPERDVLERLEEVDGLRVWRTDESGSVEVVLTSRIRFGRRVDRVRIRSEWSSD